MRHALRRFGNSAHVRPRFGAGWPKLRRPWIGDGERDMLTPPFEEWLAVLAPSERQRALELLDKFNALAARDAELWVRSEISEDIPQFARYLVLRSLWPDHIDPWARNAGTW